MCIVITVTENASCSCVIPELVDRNTLLTFFDRFDPEFIMLLASSESYS